MKNKIFPHTFWRPLLDCMSQLFFKPKYVWISVHLKGPEIPDPSGQLAELIVYITSTRVDLCSHQILLFVLLCWILCIFCDWWSNFWASAGKRLMRLTSNLLVTGLLWAALRSKLLPYFGETWAPKTYPILGKPHSYGPGAKFCLPNWISYPRLGTLF